jgi:hypothetical protein
MPAPGVPLYPNAPTIDASAFDPAQPPTPGQDSDRWNLGQVVAPYGSYGLDTTYTRDNGVLQLPVAGVPGTAPVLIQLHGGFMRKSVTAQGRRAGMPPIMPDPTAADPDGGVQAGHTVSPRGPALDGDGNTYVYQTSVGQLFYYTTFFTPSTGYRMSASPVYVDTGSANILGSSSFLTGIL